MNLTRGLFRLWLAGSVVWAALALWVSSQLPSGPNIGWAVEPPAIAAVLLILAVWALRGFSRS